MIVSQQPQRQRSVSDAPTVGCGRSRRSVFSLLFLTEAFLRLALLFVAALLSRLVVSGLFGEETLKSLEKLYSSLHGKFAQISLRCGPNG